MSLVDLKARLRTDKGKGAAHKLRQQGFLPGIVYGSGEDNQMIEVERRGFEAMMRNAAGGAVVINLKFQDKEQGSKVIIKDVQRDPATSRPLHLDLLRISMDKPVHVVVPVHLTGVAEGVKNQGGFMDHVLRELEVECLPASIPEFIELDVTELTVGGSLHVSDVRAEGVTVLTPADRVIAAVHGKTVAAAAEEAAAEEAAEGGAEAPAEGEAEGGEKTEAKKE